jgi:arabinose-5-phosphate isomerase
VLGWKAFVKVKDVMRTGEAVPIVAETATMKEALEEMTAKRRGMTTVVDSAGRLVGIVTDGDLRRLQLAGGPLLDRRVADCMSRNPKRIDADELAAKALGVMEAHQITSLVIADGDGRPHAFIHLHDILGSKIA